jgi:hypothetical protein
MRLRRSGATSPNGWRESSRIDVHDTEACLAFDSADELTGTFVDRPREKRDGRGGTRSR